MRWLLNKAVNLKEIRRMPQKRLPYYCVRDHPGSPPDSLTLPILTWLLVPRYILLEARDGAVFLLLYHHQGCISCGPCSCPELTEDHVLPSAYVEIFRTVTRNAVNKSVWRKKDCFWLPLNKHAMNIWLSSLRIRVHLSWRTEKHLHVLMHQCILWYKRNRNIFVTFQSKSLHLAA